MVRWKKFQRKSSKRTDTPDVIEESVITAVTVECTSNITESATELPLEDVTAEPVPIILLDIIDTTRDTTLSATILILSLNRAMLSSSPIMLNKSLSLHHKTSKLIKKSLMRTMDIDVTSQIVTITEVTIESTEDVLEDAIEPHT
jgi:hypothetical protein